MGQTIYTDIEIRGVTYSTVRAAAEAIGVSPDTIRLAKRNGTLHRVGLRKRGVEPMRIRIRGVDYADAHDAAAALGVTPGAIWQAVHKGSLDRVGLGPRLDKVFRSKPVRIGHREYPSLAVASRTLGFNAAYVSHVLKRGRSMERLIAAQMALDAAGEGEAWRKQVA